MPDAIDETGAISPVPGSPGTPPSGGRPATPAGASSPGVTVADRLNHLISQRSRGGHALTSAQVAAMVAEAGGRLSRQSIHDIRSGKTDPKVSSLRMLAAAFGVEPTYFIEDDPPAPLEPDLNQLVARWHGIGEKDRGAIARLVETLATQVQGDTGQHPTVTPAHDPTAEPDNPAAQ